jgi:hypothetical protein
MQVNNLPHLVALQAACCLPTRRPGYRDADTFTVSVRRLG